MAVTLGLLFASDAVGVSGRILREHGGVPGVVGAVQVGEEFGEGGFSVGALQRVIGEVEEVAVGPETEELPIALAERALLIGAMTPEEGAGLQRAA